MSDEELERLAQEAAKWGGSESRVERIKARWANAHEDRFTDAATPQVVLSLLERLKGTEEALSSSVRIAKEYLDRAVEAEKFAEFFAETAEAAVRHAENDGKGMQVPFHDDFAYAKGHPALVSELRRWARRAREVLRKP